MAGEFVFDPQLESFLEQNGMLHPSQSQDTRSLAQQRKDFLSPFL